VLVSALPNGEPSKEDVFLGAEGPGGAATEEMASTAISRDGSRVVWRTNGAGKGHLYLREVTAGKTLQVDEPNAGVKAPEAEPEPIFQTASADGSKVFFTDAQRLTENSTASEESLDERSQDLYVFEAGQEEGHRLQDLTPREQGGTAGVQAPWSERAKTDRSCTS